jgi:uracil-DNA glycosylase
MKKVFFLGQAPPRVQGDRPFGTTALYKWFDESGITDDIITHSFSFGALIDYFPGSKNGSHLVPTPKQILEAQPALIKKIRTIHPDIIVTVGIVSLRHVMQNPTLKIDDVVGTTFTTDPFGQLGYEVTVIPIPHPSGASPWTHLGDNKKRLMQALALLKEFL